MSDTPIVTAGVVVCAEDQVLLVRPGPASQHSLDLLGLPAGRLEPGESAIACAIRECWEESGLVVEEDQLIQLPKIYSGLVVRRDRDPDLMTWTVFTTTDWQGSLRVSPEAEPFWAPRALLAQLPLQTNVGLVIAEATDLLGLDR